MKFLGEILVSEASRHVCDYVIDGRKILPENKICHKNHSAISGSIKIAQSLDIFVRGNIKMQSGLYVQ